MPVIHSKLHPAAESELSAFAVPLETIVDLFQDAEWALSAASAMPLQRRSATLSSTLKDSGFEIVRRHPKLQRLVFQRTLKYRAAGNGTVQGKFTFLGDLKHHTLVLVGLTPGRAASAGHRIQDRLDALQSGT